jgi:hypothetical protein
VSAEGALEVASLELPDLDGAVLGAGGEGGVLGVEGEGGDVGLVPLEFELGRSDGYVEVVGVDVHGPLLDWSLGHLLQVLHLLLQISDLLLQGQNRLPF